MDGYLLVTTDAKRPDGVAGLGEDGGLACELLQHLGGPGQPVTRLADADVEAQLADAYLTHRVLRLVLDHGLDVLRLYTRMKIKFLKPNTLETNRASGVDQWTMNTKMRTFLAT